MTDKSCSKRANYSSYTAPARWLGRILRRKEKLWLTAAATAAAGLERAAGLKWTAAVGRETASALLLIAV